MWVKSISNSLCLWWCTLSGDERQRWPQGHLKKAKAKVKNTWRPLVPLRCKSESTKRPLVRLKAKVKIRKKIKHYYFDLSNFGRLTSDSKDIKEDQSISLLHTLFSHKYSCSIKKILQVFEEGMFYDYALALMSLAKASSLTEDQTLG